MRKPTCLEYREGCHRWGRERHMHKLGIARKCNRCIKGLMRRDYLSTNNYRKYSSARNLTTNDSAGVVATACRHRETNATREAPTVAGRARQLAIREGEAGPFGVAGGPLYR